ncbi:hypothetical protein MTZ49_10785 [Entomomonas sp. E2T0]|uniref:hypothetical protein n=1 Tax=Entomomonas sp. E2T0 TaxID=2930213 RepID=UPI0022281820|nr:hypothetical protein [Entomomonas sp. E2T0]UYZ83087.1 hypothetical protein MTZ49_10785 [Entomomonas sp. E2T0]
MAIQHTSSYLVVPHTIEQKSGFINKLFKNKEQPKTPETLLFNNQIQEHMKHYEEQGYELVSTQALLRAIDLLPTEQGITTGSAYNITDGIVFFWKRIK